MKKTKKQKRFESKHMLMFGFDYYFNLPNKKDKIKVKRFRLDKFRNLIKGFQLREKGSFLGTGRVYTRGISFDFENNKYHINCSVF